MTQKTSYLDLVFSKNKLITAKFSNFVFKGIPKNFVLNTDHWKVSHRTVYKQKVWSYVVDALFNKINGVKDKSAALRFGYVDQINGVNLDLESALVGENYSQGYYKGKLRLDIDTTSSEEYPSIVFFYTCELSK